MMMLSLPIRILLLSLVFLVGTVFSGCAVGPDFQRPSIVVPEHFKEAGHWQLATAVSQETQIEQEWWRRFNDPVLNTLQQELLSGNQSLKQAEAQYRAARAAVDSTRAGGWPSVNVSGGRSRNRSADAISSGNAITVNYNASASVSWEIDLWGRLRRSIEQSEAKAAASAADLAALRLSLQALLAQTYIELRAAEMQATHLQRAANEYQRFLQLTQYRLDAGVASPLDLTQAQSQYSSMLAQALDAENQRAQLEHALAVLMGKPPAVFTLQPGQLPRLDSVQWNVPEILPSTLIENRPDIRAAENQVAAANAQIGINTAAWFPVLNLTGNGGYKNSTLTTLFDLPNRFWSFGPTLALALLDGGARSAAVDEARARHEAAVAAYRQTVLTAFQEVEDNLSAVRLLAQAAKAQAAALQAAQRARVIAENQYQAGINSALNVVSAQTVELTAEVNSISLASRRWQAAIQLFKNAGGRWQE